MSTGRSHEAAYDPSREPSGGPGCDPCREPAPPRVEGGPGPALLMLHGWPDTLRLWDATVDVLRAQRRCVRFTLPGFDLACPGRAPTLDEVLARIDSAADAVSPDAPVELLLHDWGCVYGYAWAARRPGRVARIVGVDVGDSGSRAHRASLRVRDLAAIAAYQLWLAAAWRVGGRVGDAMTRWMAARLRAPGRPETIGASMNHPYHQAWTGRLREATRVLARLDPPCPMLFVYGERKPFMFHSPQWAEALAGRPGCAVVPMRAGHWVMRDRAGEFERVVLDWLRGGAAARA